MKSTTILLLSIAAIILGIGFFASQKELFTAKKNAAVYEKRNDDLQRELMRVNRACAEKERLLKEIEQSIRELDSKVQLETLQRYIPKKTWNEIQPVIERLRALQESRENNPAGQHEEDY